MAVSRLYTIDLVMLSKKEPMRKYKYYVSLGVQLNKKGCQNTFSTININYNSSVFNQGEVERLAPAMSIGRGCFHPPCTQDDTVSYPV